MYDPLATKGERYAATASGMAVEDTFAGVAAISYIASVVAKAGSPLSSHDIEMIKVSMTRKHLEALRDHLKEGFFLSQCRQLR